MKQRQNRFSATFQDKENTFSSTNGLKDGICIREQRLVIEVRVHRHPETIHADEDQSEDLRQTSGAHSLLCLKEVAPCYRLDVAFRLVVLRQASS